jgi:hypothetical protein
MGHDLRHYSQQTYIQLIAGFILILFIIGDGLIYLFYGRGAALMGLLCLVAGLTPIVLILAALWVIDIIARQRDNQ